MSTTATIADIAAALGVSPERVLTDPPPGTATVEDVFAAYARFDRLYELVDGTLVEKTGSGIGSYLSAGVVSQLYEFVDTRNDGLLTGAKGPFLLPSGNVRLPDVAYTSWRSLGGRRPIGRVAETSPDLAVEVLDEGNTPAEMLRKRQDFFGAGTRLVWEVEIDTRTVTVYTEPNRPVVYTEAHTLDGGAVLPRLTFSVADLFTRLDIRAPSADAGSDA